MIDEEKYPVRIAKSLEMYYEAPKLKYSLRASGLVYLVMDIVGCSTRLSLDNLKEHKCHYQELSELIDDLLEELSALETDVITMRYGLDINFPRKTLKETAESLGYSSPESIRKIQEKSILKLRYPSRSKLIMEMINL